MQDYKQVSLGDICPDPNQPRKHVTTEELEDLAQSILQKGVFQPILIRPLKKGYMLVCGERRYKASLMAQVANKNIQTIPAVIRDMTDEEALELQIIENLHRKDVHPLEEAVAFRIMVEKKKLDLKEIAARVAKSVAYVAQRLDLTFLIKPFQDLLFADRMLVTQAQDICCFDAITQRDILLSCKIPKDWESTRWTLSKQTLWFLADLQNDLAQARFKTEDPDLYPEMGKCGNCRYNSAANQLTFPNMPGKRICHNTGCYGIKTLRSYEQTLKDVLEKPGILFINNSYYLDNQGKGKIKVAEEAAGQPVLNPENFTVLDEPDHPGTLDKFVEDQDFDDDCTLEEKQEQYEHALEDYKEELTEYERKKQSAQQAFVVNGHGEGTLVSVVLKGAKNDNVGDPVTIIDLEIEEINRKEARAKELDREKIMKEVWVDMKEKYAARKTNLIVLESIAQIMIMLPKASNKTEERICELLYLKKNGYWLEKLHVWQALNKLATNKNPFTGVMPWSIMNEIERLLILDNLYSETTLDYEKNWEPAVAFGLCDAFEGTSQFVEMQHAKALKRQQNVEKKLADLQAKKEELSKPADQEPPVVPIKATKKKSVKALTAKEELN